MVFGNTGNNSGTGVAFTRDPNTGMDEFYGDYLINAQGEDVVAGIRTPEPISQRPSRVAATRACTQAPVVHESVAAVMAMPVSVGLACLTLCTVSGR